MHPNSSLTLARPYTLVLLPLLLQPYGSQLTQKWNELFEQVGFYWLLRAYLINPTKETMSGFGKRLPIE